jgi:hypothetical protein
MDVLPTMAIRMFINSLGKRTLPSTKILFRVIYYVFNINEFFTVCGGDAVTPFKMIKPFSRKIFMHLKSSPHGPKTSSADGCPAGHKEVHKHPWEEDSPHTKILFRVVY